MSDFLDDVVEQKPTKRPMFLQVLCILTFVSCGLALVNELNALIGVSSTQKNLQTAFHQMQRQQQDTPEIFDEALNAMERASGWMTTAIYLSLANVVLCCVGALLMWKMRKAGYFIYIFGQLLPFITLYGIYSIFQHVPIFGVFMLIYAIFNVVCAAAFIVMYGLNFKHMR